MFYQEYEKHGLMELFFVCDNMEGLGKYTMDDSSGIYSHIISILVQFLIFNTIESYFFFFFCTVFVLEPYCSQAKIDFVQKS